MNQHVSSPEKYERVAFTFCKMGTLGLLVWLLTPAIFVLIVALITVTLYGHATRLGLRHSRCFLRKPWLIIGFWTLIAITDAVWLIAFR